MTGPKLRVTLCSFFPRIFPRIFCFVSGVYFEKFPRDGVAPDACPLFGWRSDSVTSLISCRARESRRRCSFLAQRPSLSLSESRIPGLRPGLEAALASFRGRCAACSDAASQNYWPGCRVVRRTSMRQPEKRAPCRGCTVVPNRCLVPTLTILIHSTP